MLSYFSHSLYFKPELFCYFVALAPRTQNNLLSFKKIIFAAMLTLFIFVPKLKKSQYGRLLLSITTIEGSHICDVDSFLNIGRNMKRVNMAANLILMN